MGFRILGTLAIAASVAVAAIAPGRAAAQANRPISIVIPFAAGAGTDLLVRALLPSMVETLGTPIIVDNRPGADGVIAAEMVAKAAPDGHTLFFTSNSTHAANPSLKKSLPYDPQKDFAPIGRAVRTYLVFVARPGLGGGTIEGIVQEARTKPGGLTYGSGNSSSRIAAELLKMATRADLRYVPYKGNAQALADVVAGHVDIMFPDTSPAKPMVAAGRVKALAVTSPTRLEQFPDVPTVREVGLPDLEFSGWAALFAPAGTPAPVVARINDALRRAMKSAPALQLFEKTGLVPDPSSPEELAAFLASEIQLWKRVVEFARIEKE